MADLINLLPAHIANQIAAGEVIQRPSSVVKELMENAIDAGSSCIDVNVKDSGKTLIQVVDDGAGMTSTDASMCFERHATSKVKSAEDLFSLTTKGFRGEALASIAAIAHVELKTRQEKAETGTHLLIQGSEVISNEDVVTPKGSSFEVKNLFFNVPARRNFLKKDTTEFNHILEEFCRIALAHPELKFSLKHNGKFIYQLQEGVLRKRIVDVVGKSMNDKLVPIEEDTEIVKIKGFVLKPEASKKRRGEQYFFVNDRYFKSSYFNHAVSKAYEGLLSQNSYPSYFLYFEIDSNKIDVNVHPTKTEIKFEEDKFIYSIVLSSIRQALGKYNISPTLDFERETSFDIPHSMKGQPAVEPEIRVNDNFNPFNSVKSTNTGRKSENFTKAISSQGFGNEKASTEDWKSFYSIKDEDIGEAQQGELINETEFSSIPSFITKGNYVIVPSKSGFMIIHAVRAMEQILYTRLHNSFVSSPVESQKMLFPVELELSKGEMNKWEENKGLLQQLGYSGQVTDDKLTIDSVPSILSEESISSSVENIISILMNGEISKDDIAHELVSSLAMSGSRSPIDLKQNETVNEMIDLLFQCENHTYTPRKKKILETISLDDLKNLLS